MRFITHTFGFVILILAAFWFTAENAGVRVTMDFVLFRLHASLPLVVFGSILLGMGASALVGWRAGRAARLRSAARSPELGPPAPGFDFGEERRGEKTQPAERAPFG